MPRQRRQAARPPTHEEVKARNPIKEKRLANYTNKDALMRLSTACGLSPAGTIVELKKDLAIFQRLDWGGKTKKVTVARLRNAQGPSNVFDQVPHTPEAIFDTLFSNDMWNLLVEETNRYKPRNVRKKWDKLSQLCLTINSVRPSLSKTL